MSSKSRIIREVNAFLSETSLRDLKRDSVITEAMGPKAFMDKLVGLCRKIGYKDRVSPAGRLIRNAVGFITPDGVKVDVKAVKRAIDKLKPDEIFMHRGSWKAVWNFEDVDIFVSMKFTSEDAGVFLDYIS